MKYSTFLMTAKSEFGSTHDNAAGDWHWNDFPTQEQAQAFYKAACDNGFQAKWSRMHASRNQIMTQEIQRPTVDNPTPYRNGRYGAPMGRASNNTYTTKKGETLQLTVNEAAKPFYLREIYISNDGYDSGGCYWGIGERLYYYEASCLSDIYGYVRAKNRQAAKNAVKEIHEFARFFR